MSGMSANLVPSGYFINFLKRQKLQEAKSGE
jgi:hypothetical protein